jgi:hypothetical protein
LSTTEPRRAVATVLALLLAAGVRAAEPPRPRRLSPAEAEALVKEIGADVERIRGLKFKTPVAMKIITGAEARANFKSKIEPREEELARHVQYAYAHLGLVPRGTDLLTSYLDNAEKGVAGYYEPGTKVFYLLDHVSAEEVRGVIAHELTHALEDQHYDLKSFAKKAGGDDDFSTAISAVVEGSAMVVMMAYLSQKREHFKDAVERVENEKAERARRLQTAPSFTQRSLMLPYILGITFLLRGNVFNWIGPQGGVRIADLDQAYANPPRSTRHILHPDQYWLKPDRKFVPPSLPDMSKILGAGWSKAAEGSIGELGLSVLTGAKIDLARPEALLPTRWIDRPSTGTAGDLFHHYVNGDRRVTVLATRWESTRDADEFDEALVRARRTFFRYGTNIAVLAGDFGDRGDALAQAAFDGTRYWSPES